MINEAVNSLDPESVLPDQFFDGMRLPPGVAAERKLMLAILQDAVECYQHNLFARDPKGRDDFEEARVWIASKEDEWVFSFENICTLLGIDSDYVRDALFRMKQGHDVRSVRERVVPHIAPLAERLDRDGEEADDTIQIAS